MRRSNALWTARSPFALATTIGFAAQRLGDGSGRGGRMGKGISAALDAASPAALDARNSRRDRTDTLETPVRGDGA